MPNGTIPMSQETYDKLLAQLDDYKKNHRPQIIQEIAEARAQGDLSENAEYHAAKEKQGEIEAHIAILEDKLARAEIIRVSAADSDHIIFGATVEVLNLKSQKKQKYTLVSPDGVDIMEGKISAQSPIGKGLLGKRPGDRVDISTPKGKLELEVLSFQ